MNTKNLEQKLIDQELKSQVETRRQLVQQRDELNTRISIVDKFIAALSGVDTVEEVESLHASPDIPNESPSDTNGEEFDIETTFSIIAGYYHDRDPRVKDVIEEYQKEGISPPDRQVFRHIEELMSEGRVKQSNYPAKRNRRYCAVSPSTGEQSFVYSEGE